ncbi:MAG TPA: M42 family metallopeptidase [Anaerolineae bacterium]|nr:M42 family metallopeptidase [Anaerolineae bacterium]HPL30509.1 M42 family metallopeptidase [Anaerolineae bacterium]
MKELIRSLVEAYGPSGSEGQVRELISAQVQGAATSVRTDALGNLIATVKGTGGGRRIMLAAHMDEIGLVASYVDEKGFVRFQPIGGVSTRTLVGGRVRFAGGLRGVIGAEQKDVGDLPRIDQLFIDVGARSRESCPVAVGDVACFDRPFVDLGERLVAKAFDDRIACAVLIQAMQELGETAHEVSFVFTVQEEVGLRGAQTAAYGVDAELGIAVDVTLTGDTPQARTMAVGLGAGPAIKVKDRGMLAHQGVRRWMERTAQAEGIPYQLEVLEAGTTDGMAMQTTRAGIPVGVLSIPSRYVHTPSEMVDYQDVLNSVRLLVALLKKPVEL